MKAHIDISKTILFAFPCYWTLTVIFIALFFWKVGLNEPDLIPLALISIAIIVAAIMLAKGYYGACIPMIALGLYIALHTDQHVGHLFHLYGAYLILHYAACGMYVFRNKRKEV